MLTEELHPDQWLRIIQFLRTCSGVYVGSNSGLPTVSSLFNVPVIKSNVTPWVRDAYGKEDIIILKLVWSVGEERYLTFRETLESEIGDFHTSEHFRIAGFELVENSAEDILLATTEMNERLDGCFTSTDEDEALQEWFQSHIQSEHFLYKKPGRIGSNYLRSHRDLLD